MTYTAHIFTILPIMICIITALVGCGPNCPEPVGPNVSDKYRLEIQVVIDAMGADLNASTLRVYKASREDMPRRGLGLSYSSCDMVFLRAGDDESAIRHTMIHEALHWVSWHEGYDTMRHNLDWVGWRSTLGRAKQLYREATVGQ